MLFDKSKTRILKNATTIRKQINQNIYDQFRFNIRGCNDIQNLNERNIIFDVVESAYNNSGIDQTVFIVRSNKRAYLFNKQIRQEILNLEDELSIGDRLMVLKNN